MFVSVVGEIGRVTRSQVLRFLEACMDKHNRAVIEPGLSVFSLKMTILFASVY